MADNIQAKANTGSGTEVLAAKDIGGVLYPRSIVVDSAGNETAWATESGLTAISNKLPTLATHNPLSEEPALPVRLPDQKIWVCSFAGSGADVLSSDLTQRVMGTGISKSQASGSLAVVAGTTANAEWLARSVDVFHGSLIARFSVVASQRIANNNLMVALADSVGEGLSCTINSATSITVTKTAHGLTSQNVGQFMFVGAIVGANGVPGRYAIASVPTANTINFTVAGWPASGSCTVDLFGWNHVKTLYNGVTATSALFDAQRRGWASGDTTITINTTASPGHIGQYAMDGRNVYMLDALRASSATPTYTSRASRYENMPDDTQPLYFYVWSYNGTTAPATSTTWTLGFLAVEDSTNLPVYLAGNRAQGTNQPLPVSQVGTVTVAGTVTSNIGTGTLAAVTSANLGIPTAIADVVSAALTTTTTTAAFTPTFGISYVVQIPVAVVSGTSPTLDVGVEESPDGTANWMRVYDFPRITATGSYTSPPLPFTGNRVRYVQTVGGTTPSFTRAINRLQLSSPASMLRRQTMLNAQTTTGQGFWYTDRGALPTFAANVAGTGAVSATIRIWGRNISGAGAVLLGTIGLSGTTSAADSGVTDYRYIEYMAEVTAISGTGAAVTVVMAS